MEEAVPQESAPQKKMKKQLTGKRDDTELHTAARTGDIGLVMKILTSNEESGLKELLAKQNHSGETALFVAAEYGYVDVVKEMIKFYDFADAGIKAVNGFDAFHVASKQGHLDVLKGFAEYFPNLAITVDTSNATALHTAAMQGHIEVVNFLMELESGLANISRSNGKTALHSAARNGYLEVAKVLLEKEPSLAARRDRKGQTALHMAVKGKNTEVVEQLIRADPSSINMVDSKGNTALHIATRKGREEIVRKLLSHDQIDTEVVNRSRETALDTAEKMKNSTIGAILEDHGVKGAKFLKTEATSTARELKQTVSDIKHEVHHQLEHTHQTKRNVQRMRKQISKMHKEGLNNAINSTTVVAVLIATVAFAAIFSLPGQYVDDPSNVLPDQSLGQAHIARQVPFLIFFIFDSVALFISLAVVVFQTSIVIVQKEAKKQMMAYINKLMWMACGMVSVAYLSLCYIVVGDNGKMLAVSVTIIGAIIMVPTLGIMCYWVIRYRKKTSKSRTLRRSSHTSRSMSLSMPVSLMSEFDRSNEFDSKIYAL